MPLHYLLGLVAMRPWQEASTMDASQLVLLLFTKMEPVVALVFR
uniref:Uncharacterized protein n=1 Tax=Rhizophora mucronata TaxID=61149 RepID=A0A2P2IQ37_RHIMU